MSEKQSPNVFLVVVGIVLLVVATGSIVLGSMGLGGMMKDTILVVAPGEETITLEESGTYTVFHETRSVVDGVKYAGNHIPDDILLVSADGGDLIAIESIGGYSNYSIGDREGESVFRFVIEIPGEYVLTTKYNGDDDPGETVLSIAHWHFDFTRLAIGMGIFSLLLGSGIG